jgi:AcrR family transcriptional regulator
MKKRKEIQIDRRVQKTKKLLVETFVQLVNEKGYDSVSIQDIIERANVGRSTFYSHFEDKKHLLLYGHDDFWKYLLDNEKKDNAPGKEFNFAELFKMAGDKFQQSKESSGKEASEILKSGLGEQGGDILLSHLKEAISSRIYTDYKHKIEEGLNEKMFMLLVGAATSAIVSLIIEWLENDMPYPPGEMAENAERILKGMLG